MHPQIARDCLPGLPDERRGYDDDIRLFGLFGLFGVIVKAGCRSTVSRRGESDASLRMGDLPLRFRPSASRRAAPETQCSPACVEVA
jgi:hypothetical protein